MSDEHRFHANEDGGLIFDNDFEHDAMFRVHGDFGTDEERVAYTATIVSLLNHRAQPEPAAPQPAGPEDMAVYAAIAANYKAAPTVVRTMSTTDEIMALSETYAEAERLTHREQAWNALRTAVERLVAAPTVVEPVAWMSTDCIGERYLCFTKPLDNDPVTPLYAHPPRTVLTKKQVLAVWAETLCEYNKNASSNVIIDYARAIEAAHGITKGGAT
jgi:hypothetical protein